MGSLSSADIWTLTRKRVNYEKKWPEGKFEGAYAARFKCTRKLSVSERWKTKVYKYPQKNNK